MKHPEEWAAIEKRSELAADLIDQAGDKLAAAKANLHLGKSRVSLNDLSEAERLIHDAHTHVHRIYELKRGIHGGK
jgi:hypothetical protein